MASDPELKAAVDALTTLPADARADVLTLARTWGALPTAMRAGIVAMVRSATGGGQ